MKVVALLLALLLPVTAFVPRARMPARPSGARVRMQAGVVGEDVASLLSSNRAQIDSLGAIAPELSEITRLRFALAFDTQVEAEKALRETVAWRSGAGKSIVESAEAAVAAATAGGAWDNEPVRAAAPYASAVNPYISPKNTLTLSTDDGDLVYCIRASLIDDKKLMDSVSVEQLTDFLLYVKEIHSLIVNMRSEKSGRFCKVIFANDITGVRQPPDSRFSKALSESSKSYEQLYPSLAGQTMILNLPFILQAFVGLFKPLFPKSVQERLVFTRAPVLAGLGELTPLTTNPTTKKAFLMEIKKLLG